MVSSHLERIRLLTAGIAVALVAVLCLIGGTVPGDVAPGPLPKGPAKLRIDASAPAETPPRVARVAVGAVRFGLRSNADVADAEAGKEHRGVTPIEVTLRTRDAREAEEAIGRIRAAVDPGPLKLSYSAPALELASARESVQGDLGRLELLVAPLALIAVVWLMGLRGASLAILAGAASVASALIALRVVNGYLFAVAPAAAVGIAQAVELSALFVGLYRDEAHFTPFGAARRALGSWLRPAALTTAVRALVPLALLETSFHGAGAIATATAAASVVAFGAVAVFGGTMLSLLGGEPAGSPQEGSVGGRVRATPRALARDRRKLGAAIVVAIAATALLAVPATHLRLGAFFAGVSGDVTHGLGLAAVLVALGLAAVLALGHDTVTRLRLAPASVHALAASAAATGLVVWASQDGHIAGLAGPGFVYGGALAGLLVAVTAIAAGRAALAAVVSRLEGRGLGRIGAAEVAAGLTVPSAAASTVVVAAVFGALAGVGQEAAQQVGFAIAAGVVVDLVLWRVPFLGWLARWGGG